MTRLPGTIGEWTVGVPQGLVPLSTVSGRAARLLPRPPLLEAVQIGRRLVPLTSCGLSGTRVGGIVRLVPAPPRSRPG